MISCTRCNKSVDSDSIEFSTFVCIECQEMINLPGYKDELFELEQLGDTSTASQKRRIEFLKVKIDSIK